MPPRCKKRNRLASRRRLNVARPTEGRMLVPAPTPSAATSPLVRLMLVQSLDRDGHLVDPTKF